MGRPSDSPNYPYEAEPYPLLRATPDFWWMNETDRANAFEARAIAYGGEGYLYHPGIEEGRERKR
jgi:hypothetical protein